MQRHCCQKTTDLHNRTLNLKILFTLHGIIYSRSATQASNMQILLRAAGAWRFFCIEPDFNQESCIYKTKQNPHNLQQKSSLERAVQAPTGVRPTWQISSSSCMYWPGKLTGSKPWESTSESSGLWNSLFACDICSISSSNQNTATPTLHQVWFDRIWEVGHNTKSSICFFCNQ